MSIFTQERIEEISEAMKTKESFHDFRNKNYPSMQITDSYDTGIVAVSCRSTDKLGEVNIYSPCTVRKKWSLFQQVIGTIHNGHFGWNIDLSKDGRWLAVGAPAGGDDGRGLVYIYFNSPGSLGFKLVDILSPKGLEHVSRDYGVDVTWYAEKEPDEYSLLIEAVNKHNVSIVANEYSTALEKPSYKPDETQANIIKQIKVLEETLKVLHGQLHSDLTECVKNRDPISHL